MKKIFATQLNGGHLGKKVRISIKGTEAHVEDVIKGVRHERFGVSSLNTFVKLSTIQSPSVVATADDWFRFDLNDQLEVSE